ncbi:MAG: hypothetical protein H6996_05735 [Moraxellaceae bacterium]|nr:hypothetical protein [Pseudomonadales bacterium]MCP5174596.1 hypothetical protein [Moraxellaceae bacterium]MCP5177880.1 hypothetical protein [Moraxellaceae bacterium]
MRLALILLSSSLLMTSINSYAMPAFARYYKQQYGYMPSCHACHSEGGGTPLNNYGKAFKDNGKSLAALAKIASLDSDGDGAANGVEAQAKANPADKHSTPAKAGTWLDLASLIPKEVQALFPAIRSWLPKDAVLTSADIATAKTMGAILSAADENTIYIPVENQRPAGTALIFPAQYQGKTFFLLMATDKQLKITQIKVMNAKDVPAAKKSAVYGKLVGLAAQSIPTPTTKDLDAAITQAVKNAGVLLYVRLKGA